MSRKAYECHKPLSKEEIDLLIFAPPTTKERKFMQKSLQSCKTYLNQQGIYEYQSYISSFVNRGYNAAYIIDLFSPFIEKTKMDWLSKRLFKKANFFEKNLMMNRIVHEHEINFMKFLTSDFPQCLTKPADFDTFINEFNNNVQKAKGQAISLIQEEHTDSFSNISDYENNTYGYPFEYQFDSPFEDFSCL